MVIALHIYHQRVKGIWGHPLSKALVVYQLNFRAAHILRLIVIQFVPNACVFVVLLKIGLRDEGDGAFIHIIVVHLRLQNGKEAAGEQTIAPCRLLLLVGSCGTQHLHGIARNGSIFGDGGLVRLVMTVVAFHQKGQIRKNALRLPLAVDIL